MMLIELLKHLYVSHLPRTDTSTKIFIHVDDNKLEYDCHHEDCIFDRCPYNDECEEQKFYGEPLTYICRFPLSYCEDFMKDVEKYLYCKVNSFSLDNEHIDIYIYHSTIMNYFTDIQEVYYAIYKGIRGIQEKQKTDKNNQLLEEMVKELNLMTANGESYFRKLHDDIKSITGKNYFTRFNNHYHY